MKATPDLGLAKQVKIAAGTMRLVLAPAVLEEHDSVYTLTNGMGIKDLTCSENADKEICASSLTGFATLWMASKDGWNTGETIWKPIDAESPALGAIFRSRFTGDRDLVATFQAQDLATQIPASTQSPASTWLRSPAPTPTIDLAGWREFKAQELADCWDYVLSGGGRTDQIVLAAAHAEPSRAPVLNAGTIGCGAADGVWYPNGYPGGRGIGRTGTCWTANFSGDLDYYDADRHFPGWRDVSPAADSTVIGAEADGSFYTACYMMGWHLMLH